LIRKATRHPIHVYNFPPFYIDADMVKDQLSKKLPKGPTENPIYFEIVNGEVALPGVIIAGNDRQTPEPENSQQEEIHTSVSDDNHEDDDNSSTSRYEWKTTITRKMLSILEDKKTASDKDFILTKKLWADVAKCIAKDISGSAPSATQCREKFYSLKRGYRKFLSECKKTGNKRPKPFYFETEMQLLLNDDPAFKPPVLKSSLGTQEVNNNNSGNQDDDEEEEDVVDPKSTHTAPPAKKRNRFDELKQFLEERDNRFVEAMKGMQDTQNKLMEKLIEKL